MKKWLIGCLMILLFAAPPALAAHNKADGSVCNGGMGYYVLQGSENRTSTQHRMACNKCGAAMWEDHWTSSSSGPATCQDQAICGLCQMKFGPRGPHNLVHRDAKAPTCTEKGWNEYDACSRCNYATYYTEIPALNHDLVPHAAKAPTCLDIGWNEYDTCSRCDHITYAELPALGHDYQMTIVEPTCVKNGYTLAICSRCKDTYTDHPEQKLLHRYGEWSPSGDNTHSADCRRDGCKHTDKTNCRNLEFQTKENESLTFCPVCGAVENGERLERIKKVQTAAVTGKLPAGEAVVRMNGAYLSIAFEYGGELTAPTGQVKITLPAESAELPDGKILTVIAPDGSEMEIPVTTNDKGASFTLDFTDPEIPVMLIRTNSEA